MDPDRGEVFCENICRSPAFRSKIGGLYISITAALERLGAKNIAIPTLIQEKIVKARDALKDKERLIGIMRAEVAAREARVEVLRSTLECAENKEWEPLIGFETRLLRLPPRPGFKRARRKPLVNAPRR